MKKSKAKKVILIILVICFLYVSFVRAPSKVVISFDETAESVRDVTTCASLESSGYWIRTEEPDGDWSKAKPGDELKVGFEIVPTFFRSYPWSLRKMDITINGEKPTSVELIKPDNEGRFPLGITLRVRTLYVEYTFVVK